MCIGGGQGGAGLCEIYQGPLRETKFRRRGRTDRAVFI